MEILIKKTSLHQCEYKILRCDKSVEIITLDIKTFFLHDICHYVVEKKLCYKKGFWGMLAKGHSFSQLFGKENTSTAELRFIEKIVGPVQSVFSGHIPPQDFLTYITHLNFDFTSDSLKESLEEIATIIKHWEQLSVGQHLCLLWD